MGAVRASMAERLAMEEMAALGAMAAMEPSAASTAITAKSERTSRHSSTTCAAPSTAAFSFQIIPNLMKTFLLIFFVSFGSLMAGVTDYDALRQIYPQLSERRDYTLKGDGSLGGWKINDNRFPQPTPEQLAAVKTQIATTNATIVNLRAALLVEFGKMAPGEQLMFRPVMDAVTLKLAVKDVFGAKLVISTAPAPTPSLAAAQARLVALFPQ